MRQNVAIQGIQARIVEVRRQHALAKVVEDHDPRRTAKTAKSLLVKLGPHTRLFSMRAAGDHQVCGFGDLVYRTIETLPQRRGRSDSERREDADRNQFSLRS
jgi:hypothetical protein